MPHLELVTGSRKTNSAQELHAGWGVCLIWRTTPSSAAGRQAGPTVWTSRPRLPTGSSPAAGASAVLVRPDGHVAWATPGSHHALPKRSSAGSAPPDLTVWTRRCGCTAR
ncbi:aromatic-ring hydroxylase C-terminal domain-containing protein [Streptomyces sp. NBC_00576]|uniref:aromatic-ring hydroxylase C-terminal domain-containing protein n=1 Tax=Streptomyces sp. NBC_00576 TaxID=2903665 RepID=UPI003FCC49F1